MLIPLGGRAGGSMWTPPAATRSTTMRPPGRPPGTALRPRGSLGVNSSTATPPTTWQAGTASPVANGLVEPFKHADSLIIIIIIIS